MFVNSGLPYIFKGNNGIYSFIIVPFLNLKLSFFSFELYLTNFSCS